MARGLGRRRTVILSVKLIARGCNSCSIRYFTDTLNIDILSNFFVVAIVAKCEMKVHFLKSGTPINNKNNTIPSVA